MTRYEWTHPLSGVTRESAPVATPPRAPPTVRPGWKMPKPPRDGCKPYAYIIGGEDGVDLFWATDEQIESGDCGGGYDQIDWPFGDDDYATREDFRALGFLDPECANETEGGAT